MAGLTSLRQGYGGPPERFARRPKPCATTARDYEQRRSNRDGYDRLA